MWDVIVYAYCNASHNFSDSTFLLPKEVSTEHIRGLWPNSTISLTSI